MATIDESDEPDGPLNRWVQRAMEDPERVYRALFYTAMVFFMVTTLFPFYWLLVLAVTPNSEITGGGFIPEIDLFGVNIPFPLPVPQGFNPGSFVAVFQEIPFHLYMLNSFALAVTTTIIVLVVASLAGYVFGRLEFPGRAILMLGILAISYFPPAAFVVPLYDIFGLAFNYPQLYNTPGAVTLPLSALIMPLVIFILATFYGQIPDGIEDAARIEGSTRIGALFKVIMPLSAPGVATAGILTFIIVYNEFFFSFLMLEGNAQEWGVLLHGIFRYQGTRSQAHNLMAAASLVGVVPMAVIVALDQDKIVSGLTQGALKE